MTYRPPRMQRLPKPEGAILPGHHWEVGEEPEPKRWKVFTPEMAELIGGHFCRFGGGNGRRACGRPAVALLDRGRVGRTKPVWWAYCDEPGHMYAYWIEYGKVVCWVLKPDSPDHAK